KLQAPITRLEGGFKIDIEAASASRIPGAVNTLRTGEDQTVTVGLYHYLGTRAPADSRAHLFGASPRASGFRFRLPQTVAEAHVPTVRRPFPRPRVAQPGLSRRIGAGQMTGDARLSRD